ncbi:cytochrome b [Gilvimarinus sp. SDUM040013]|uniref:Cytochrome b n=1 Tax=Gilvimarinus gilvus TaxID=3058038 RepID=A0ABU4RZP1_9GAMM|nr:cytochrome b [Gilvimarinus sp. SDUM040013]MDO3384649.1 cytochrome b [Gilvimarinus sp. SDUM040013]MDX6850235.1 cytochrome b [Gilvimarinus sp. SDUM040013]
MNPSTSKKTLSARVLHWSVAFTILLLIPMGFYMSDGHAYWLYDWHKTISMLLLVILVFRVLYRLIQGWPEASGDYTKFEQVTARVVHWLLLVAVLVLPISGIMYSGLGGFGVPVFGLEVIPSNYINGEAQAYSAYWSDIGKEIHSLSGWILSGVVVLHVAGALKHHMVDKDNTLKRMLRG